MKTRTAMTCSLIMDPIVSQEEVRALLELESPVRPRPKRFQVSKSFDVDDIILRINQLTEDLNGLKTS